MNLILYETYKNAGLMNRKQVSRIDSGKLRELEI